MDKAGGVIGPLVGLAVFQLADSSFDTVFVVATAPCLLSVAILFGMSIPQQGISKASALREGLGARSSSGDGSSWARPELLVVGLHSAGALSASLLVWTAFGHTRSATTVLLAFALGLSATALSSVPAGVLVDRFSAAWVVLSGVSVWSVALTAALVLDASPRWPYVVLPLVDVGDGLGCSAGFLQVSLGERVVRGRLLGPLLLS